MKKLKQFLTIVLLLTLFSSCVNMGLYDSMEFKDNSNTEYILKHAYGGYYFLEVKDDSGRYIPDNRYERMLRKECRKNEREDKKLDKDNQ